MKAQREMELKNESVLKVIRLVDGLSESQIHWIRTYTNYRKSKLTMKITEMDMKPMLSERNDAIEGIVGIKVHDAFHRATPNVLNENKTELNEFLSKAHVKINKEEEGFIGV